MKEYIPRNIKKAEKKFIMNFTLRQSLFIGIGGGALLAITFALQTFIPLTVALFIAAICAVPVFMIGFVKISDITLDRIIINAVMNALYKLNYRPFEREENIYEQ